MEFTLPNALPSSHSTGVGTFVKSRMGSRLFYLPMHTTQTEGGTSFIHHGDYSGEVTVVTGRKRMQVPMSDLKEFIAESIRQNAINCLEEMTTEQILSFKGAFPAAPPLEGT